MSNSLHDLKKAAEAKRFRARAGRVDSLSDGHDKAAGDGAENWQSVPHLPAGEAAVELKPPSMALEEMAAERLSPRQLSDDDFTNHNRVMPPIEPAHSLSNGQAGSPVVPAANGTAPVSAAPAASPAGGGAAPPASGGGGSGGDGGDGGESGKRPWTKPVAGTLELGLPHGIPADSGDLPATEAAQDSTAELNPPLRIKNGPWLILLAALLLLGGGAYYWWQYQTLPIDIKALQVPKIALPAASLPETLPLATAPTVASTVASSVASALPGTTETAPVIQPLNPPVTRPAKASRPRLHGDAARVEERSMAPDGAGVHFDTHNQDTRVPLPLMTAYRAFQDGNYAKAEENYRRVLQQDPRNRDALLGMAALAVKRGGASGEAAKIYRHILALYPRDTTAQAGLYALSPGGAEAESGLQQLARQQPAAAFTLANLYAGQSRWSEAQSAYFLALSQDAANADYAFNLAVSLEHLQENKMAARYYRQALQHAANKKVSFDRNEAEARLKALDTP
ncbi:MAG: tetratricopeptide repeat protein [Iodobacter sp.]